MKRPLTSSPSLLPYQGQWPTISPHAFVADNAKVIGDTHIDANASIWFGCVLRGDVNEIRIGKDTNVQDLTMIHGAETGQGVYLGSGITVGHSAVLHACNIEDNAFVGIQACVMDDCIVENGAMLAAGALLTVGKIVPANEVWAGRPAKKLRDITEQDIEFFATNRQRYKRLAREYKQVQSKMYHAE